MDELRVQDLMTRSVITVTTPGNRRAALKKMVTKHISGIVVVEKHSEKPVGIITRKDMFNNPMEEQLALLMTENPITIGPDASIRECVELLVTRNIHRLPVVEDERLIGVITPCDLLKTIEMKDIKVHVKEYKKPYCQPIHQVSPIIIALHTMKINKNYAVPVVNSDLEVVGIVTDRDLFEKSKMSSDIVESYIGITEDEDSWSWEGVRTFAKMFYNLDKVGVPEGSVSDVMVKNVKTLFEEAPVSRAATVMKKWKYDQLPLVDAKDRISGIVTSYGILPALLE